MVAFLVHEESGSTQLVHGVGDASDVLSVVFPGCAGFLVKAGTASYRHSTGLDSARTSCSWLRVGRVNVGEPVKDSKSALCRDRGGTRPIRCRRCTSLSPARGAIWPCEDGFLCRHISHSDRSPCRRCIWAWSCRPRSMPHTASVIGTGPDVAHQPDPRTATQATASALNKRELLALALIR